MRVQISSVMKLMFYEGTRTETPTQDEKLSQGKLVKKHVYISIFTNSSARTGYDARSIFKRSLTGLNSEFSFS